MIGPPRLSFHQELAMKATLQSSTNMFVTGRQLDKHGRISEEQAAFLHLDIYQRRGGGVGWGGGFTSVHGAQGLWHCLEYLLMSDMLVDDKVNSFFFFPEVISRKLSENCRVK